MQVNDMHMAIPCRRRGGFTLVEVMISVALVLVLIIGINQIFKVTSDTVSAGQVMSGNVRDIRAAQGVLHSDGAAAAQNPPMFIIAASRVSAFRNANDQANDRDYDPAAAPAAKEIALRTLDLNGDNDEVDPAVAPFPYGELTPPAIYNHRSHRTDRLGFFARDIFRRQTADNGAFASAISSSEAWIWYGHLKLANSPVAPTAPEYFQPGQFDTATGRNQNNFLASQFALGRMVMLLRDPNTIGPPAENLIHRLPRIPATGTPGASTTLTPLAWRSPSGPSDAAPDATAPRIQESRYDLAATTIDQFRIDLSAIATGATPPEWWHWFTYEHPGGNTTAVPTPVPLDDTPREYRFHANRYFTKPLDSRQAAELAPILLSGCSQFIVEFAGDYVTQAANGAVTPGSGPDGITDFVVNTGISPDHRSVRWYGMPRDVDGPTGAPDGHILAGASDPKVDVLPVSVVRGGVVTFERNVATEMPAKADYADPVATSGMAPNARYTCVWGPDTALVIDPVTGLPRDGLPQMLRITIVLDDLNGRLAEGQQYEFVIDLPY